MKFYCDIDAIESQIALIALYEKKKDFKILSSMDGIQMALHLSGGKLPLLVTREAADKTEERISGLAAILVYLGYDQLEDNMWSILSVVNLLTYGTCQHADKVVSQIRWPYNEANVRDKVIQNRLDIMTHLKVEKPNEIEMTLDDVACHLTRINHFLESIQMQYLQNEQRIGVWLSGVQFSSLDCLVTGILLRLHQLGHDSLWSEGEKADIAMYANQAFQRASALKAVPWKDHQSEISIFDQESPEVKHARYACYAAIGLASVYVVKKVFFKK